MKRFRKDGNFWLCFILNLLMNLELTIPALILLGLHFWQNIHIKWFWIALAFWPLVVLLRMIILRLLISGGNCSEPPKENKNPYSVKGINDK